MDKRGTAELAEECWWSYWRRVARIALGDGWVLMKENSGLAVVVPAGLTAAVFLIAKRPDDFVSALWGLGATVAAGLALSLVWFLLGFVRVPAHLSRQDANQIEQLAVLLDRSRPTAILDYEHDLSKPRFILRVTAGDQAVRVDDIELDAGGVNNLSKRWDGLLDPNELERQISAHGAATWTLSAAHLRWRARETPDGERIRLRAVVRDSRDARFLSTYAELAPETVDAWRGQSHIGIGLDRVFRRTLDGKALSMQVRVFESGSDPDVRRTLTLALTSESSERVYIEGVYIQCESGARFPAKAPDLPLQLERQAATCSFQWDWDRLRVDALLSRQPANRARWPLLLAARQGRDEVEERRVERLSAEQLGLSANHIESGDDTNLQIVVMGKENSARTPHFMLYNPVTHVTTRGEEPEPVRR